ncbi:MAG: hypothetical protein ACHRHE_03745 [Tepidisphaerales bacterium]
MRPQITVFLILALCGSCARAAEPVKAPDKGSGAGLGQDKVVVDPATENAIRGALKYMASKQNGNGSWSASDGEKHEVAMTGYVLMAFLVCGQLPDEGEYGKNVTAGVNFLLNAVKPDGFIQYGGGTNMYGHGIASIALAEVYGQTRDVRIRPKLEAAIKLIINCQNDQGGWRYAPRRSDADISVTVLQVVALRAAKNGGLDVPQTTIDRAVAYVRTCYDENSGGFTYQPRNNSPGFARTAAAIYSLQVCGQYDDRRVKTGSEYLVKHARNDRQWFTYGNFYAAPAQYMIGGDTWEKWYGDMKDQLLKTTDQNGLMRVQGELVSWEPKWDSGGRVGTIYSTAVYTMILAMPYHYLPLYQR